MTISKKMSAAPYRQTPLRAFWRRQVASTWRNGVAAVVACGPREVRLADPSGSQEHVFLVVFDELV